MIGALELFLCAAGTVEFVLALGAIGFSITTHRGIEANSFVEFALEFFRVRIFIAAFDGYFAFINAIDFVRKVTAVVISITP